MSNNSGLGVWKWVLIALVVCNAALIATIWIKGNTGNFPPPHRPVRFKEALSLSAEQEARFKEMAMANRAKIDSIKKLAKAARESYFNTISNVDASTSYTDSLLKQLGYYHECIEQQTYTHFKEVRTILNAEQQRSFDKVIQDVLRQLPEQPRVKGDMPGPGRPEPGMGDGPPPPGAGGPPPM